MKTHHNSCVCVIWIDQKLINVRGHLTQIMYLVIYHKHNNHYTIYIYHDMFLFHLKLFYTYSTSVVENEMRKINSIASSFIFRVLTLFRAKCNQILKKKITIFGSKLLHVRILSKSRRSFLISWYLNMLSKIILSYWKQSS